MIESRLLKSVFERALPYRAYLATGAPHHQQNWNTFDAHSRADAPLTDTQRALLASFTRRINILVLSGIWCGDCVQQCPLLAQLAECNPATGPTPTTGSIDLRFIDRDDAADLSEYLMICAGRRVPVVLFMNEDLDFVALAGDRTLTRYRALASRKLGPSCPLPGAPLPADEIAATRQDWLDEFERVHLLLRLSPMLRHRHGD